MNMKIDSKNLVKYEKIGFVLTSALGTLMHFVYDWSNKAFIVGLFAPVNESPWEHLKLLYFPFILFALWEAHKLEQDKFNVFFGKLIGIMIGMYITLSIYYISMGAFGKSPDWVNIFSFFAGMAIAYTISFFIIHYSIGRGMPNGISFGLIIVIAITFVLLTVYPIKIPLFQDPQNLSYGI